jgi:TonB family protein
MNFLAVLPLALGLTAPAPMPSDTPPTFPAPISRLAALNSAQDVIGVSLMADGKAAPATLVLPSLINRRHTLEYMRVHYPESMRKVISNATPVAWVFVNEKGRVSHARLLTSSGYPALDSLSLATVSVAEFAPAKHDNRPVGVWVPFPARVPPHEQLITAIASMERDMTEAPGHTPHTQKPVLLNRGQVEAAIVRVMHGANKGIAEVNEAFARNQRIGGTAEMWLLIKADGSVGNMQFKKKTGSADLDTAAQTVAQLMRFAPGKNGDVPVDVWLEVPIKFSDR